MLTNGNCSGADGRRERVGRRRDVGVAGRDAAVPHRRLAAGRNVALARGGTDVLVREFDPAEIVDALGTRHHQRVPRAGGAPDDAARCPGVDDARLLGLRSIVYGASPITDEVLKRAMEMFGAVRSRSTASPRPPARSPSWRPADHDPDGRAPAPAALGRQALPVGGDEDRRPGHRRGLRGPARSARSGPARAQNMPRLLAAARGDRARPSTRTAGSTPATPATSTTRATCSSPTGSRT